VKLGMFPNDESTGQMQQRLIIVYLPLPTYEQAPKPIHPGVRAFAHPPSCSVASAYPGDQVGAAICHIGKDSPSFGNLQRLQF
jgi:hypothetical protein